MSLGVTEEHRNDDDTNAPPVNTHTTTRRQSIQKLQYALLPVLLLPSTPSIAAAGDAATLTSAPPKMKTFVDPQGLFSLTVPQSFYTLRRTAKGDLPDAKTGKGRRGSSIFTAGDMAKAEIVAVERFPTVAFLEDEGGIVNPTGDLSTFTGLGQPAAIAKLLALRRDRDKGGQSTTAVIPESVALSEDGKTLRFELRTRIEVQKPELLMEQMGVSELVRVTLGRAELRGVQEGQMMVCYASALEKDFMGGDGVALRETIESFKVL